MTKIYPHVVDLSHHNFDERPDEIDWQAAKRDGLWGVIFKATEATDYIDPYYNDIRREVKEAGLLWGAYHFFRPGNVIAQVNHFLLNAAPGPETLLVLDHEDEGCSLEDVKEFLLLVEQLTGQRPALYSGHVLKEQIGNRIDSYLAGTRLWLAQYGPELEWPPCWDRHGVWLWQYTDGDVGPGPHAIAGIGYCDINSFDGTHDQLKQTWAEASIAPPKPPPRPPMPQPDKAPPWLTVMRSITGMTEAPGSADNPHIMHMADTIGRKYPEQKAYADLYTGDDIAWCGLTVAYCMAMSNIEPVFGKTDTERWMWAQSWADWDQSTHLTKPKLGCVVVQSRDGGGHVTLFERWEGSKLICLGGNQSDMVKESSYDPGVVIAYVWPSEHGRPSVDIGTMNPEEVCWTQASLNLVAEADLDVDGEMGPLTRDAISSFQKKNDLPVTGAATKETVDELLGELADWNEQRGPGDGHGR